MTVEAPAAPLSSSTVSPSERPLKFSNSDRFLHSLRKRVDAYFDKKGISRRDSPRMYFKTATILAWFFGAYFLLLFAVHSWYLILPLAVIMGLGLAAIGFNI